MPEYGPGEGDRRPSYAPFEHVTRVQAVRDFVDWLYDTGPDPNGVGRERLLRTYWDRVAAEAMQSAAASVAHDGYVRPLGPERQRALDEAINKVVPFPVIGLDRE